MKKLSRRDFVKGIGAGAALAGLGAGLRAERAEARSSTRQIARPLPRALEANALSRLAVEGSTDPLAASTVQIAENMEPVIPHDDQVAVAKAEAGRPGEEDRQEAEHPDLPDGQRGLRRPRHQRRRLAVRRADAQHGPPGPRRSASPVDLLAAFVYAHALHDSDRTPAHAARARCGPASPANRASWR